jgi:hypothetical protein
MVNYLPQYNVSDSFGFPSTMTWTNGSQTASTSETLNNLPAGTNLICRVLSVDPTSATNYFPWQAVMTGGRGAVPVYLPFRY